MSIAFEKAKVCYEQNCEQMRSLNQIMWQVPMIAMTLTGGLWYGVATLKDIDSSIKFWLLLFGAVANVCLVFMINRVRSVMRVYLNKMREFHPAGYADASFPDGFVLFRDRGVCNTFSLLMAIAAVMCVVAAFMNRSCL